MSATSKPRLYRLPLGPRIFSIISVGVLGLTTAFMVAGALFVFPNHLPLGLLMAVVAVFLGALTGYVFRDLRGKLGLYVTLDNDAASFRLPAGRSLIHRPPAQQLTVPYSEIEAIETRYEGYRSLGLAMMMQTFVLHLKDGKLIFLFEDRAKATTLGNTLFRDIVSDLVGRAHVPLRELGTVEGGGGLLCAWGTRAPDWAAPPLPRDQALRLWRHAAATGALTMSILLLLVVTRLAMGS